MVKRPWSAIEPATHAAAGVYILIGKVNGRVEHGPAPETELIAAAQSGDIAAYEQLVLLHEQTALRAAFLVVRDPTLAEDVSQEAFIRAYRSLGGFRDGAQFRPWLMRIVVNQARNLNRADRSRAATAQRYGDELHMAKAPRRSRQWLKPKGATGSSMP